MKKVFLIAVVCVLAAACSDRPTLPGTGNSSATTDSSATKTPPPVEFADQKYVDWGKKANTQFENGDIDGWSSQIAPDAIFRWSSGDSLMGKVAILKYWKERRTHVIDSVRFSNDIWLPLKVNQPQQKMESPGIWLLHWSQVNAKYKSGKAIQFWRHVDYHFNDNDQVDQIIEYIDHAPINAAAKK
ncbi:MAG TPA: hypothetical protein VMH01_16340 [Puia sp.]|nr:hypothetical protein [Puia sp.]